MKPHADAGIEPFASRMNADPEEMISIFAPDDIEIVVAGGETQGAFKMISGRLVGGSSLRAGAARGSPLFSIDDWR